MREERERLQCLWLGRQVDSGTSCCICTALHCLGMFGSANIQPSQALRTTWMLLKSKLPVEFVSLCNNRLHWLKYPNFARLFSLSMCICKTLATLPCFPLQSAPLSLSVCHSSTLKFGLLLASPSSVLSAFPRAFQRLYQLYPGLYWREIFVWRVAAAQHCSLGHCSPPRGCCFGVFLSVFDVRKTT